MSNQTVLGKDLMISTIYAGLGRPKYGFDAMGLGY